MVIRITLLFGFVLCINGIKYNLIKNESCNCYRELFETNYFNKARFLLIGNLAEETFKVYTEKMIADVNNLPKYIELLNRHQDSFLIPNNYIIKYDTEKGFIKILQLLETSYKYFSSRNTFIIITNGSNNTQIIADYLLSKNVYKAMIIVQDIDFHIYGLNLKYSNCATRSFPTVIKSCVQNQLTNRNKVFPHDMNDLKEIYYKCPIKILWVTTEPWVYEVNGAEPGILVRVIKLFSEISNVELIFEPDNPDFEEELRWSYSFNYLLQEFDNGRGDIFVGLGSNLLMNIFDVTGTITDNNLYWIVPKPKNIPFYQIFLNYFPQKYSIIYWITFFIFLHILYYASKMLKDNVFKTYLDVFFYMYSIILGVAYYKHPRKISLRILVLVYFISSLIAVIYIQVRLYLIFRKYPTEEPIDSMEKLINSDMPIKILNSMSVLFLFNGPENQKIFDRHIPFDNLSFGEVANYALEKQDFATIVDQGMMIKQPNIKHKMVCFQFFTFQVSMFMKKRHILFQYFNEMVQRIIEHGFIVKFIEDTKVKYTLKNLSTHTDEYLAIPLSYMSGAFYCLIAGYLISLFVSVAEKLFFIYSNRNKELKI